MKELILTKRIGQWICFNGEERCWICGFRLPKVEYYEDGKPTCERDYRGREKLGYYKK